MSDCYFYLELFYLSNNVWVILNRGNIEWIVRGNVNYIWNFVKVMVDVYNGMMKFFVVDENDLVLNIYCKIFF